MEKFSMNIPVVRHLDETDDLLNFGRDGELLPGQEQKAEQIATILYSELKNENKRALMFVCSAKKRAIQTADLLVEQIKKMDSEVKTKVTTEDGLNSIDEGEFLLADNYKPGEFFEGLDIAQKVFSNEVHASDNGKVPDNYLYRFGDPVAQSDGSFKYPELATYFKRYGENYKEVLLRIYGLIIKTYENQHQLSRKIKIVVVTHGQPAQIFKDLNAVAKKIRDSNLEIKPGQLPKLCWEEYNKRDKSERVTGQTDLVSIENLCDPELISVLKKEIEYLENL